MSLMVFLRLSKYVGLIYWFFLARATLLSIYLRKFALQLEKAGLLQPINGKADEVFIGLPFQKTKSELLCG